MNHLINSTLEQEYGGSASELSGWYGDAGKLFDGEDVIFPGGFSQVITGMAEGLDIRLSHPVAALGPVGSRWPTARHSRRTASL